MIINSIFSLLVILSPYFIEDPGDDWSDWRGKDRRGEWHEDGVITKFESYRMPLKWSVPVSAGYSGPTVSENKVYLTDRLTKPQRERVSCFDAMTGETIWSYTYECDYVGIGYPAGPRASVVIDGSSAYSLGAMGHLYCFRKESGEVVWSRDLNKDYEIRMPIWGIAGAPLVVEDKLILNIGGSNGACIVALDKVSGKEIWKNLEDDASYVAPILISQAGRPVVVVWTGQHIVGMSPDAGRVYWKQKFDQSKMVINIVNPVIQDNYMFLSTFYDGSMLLKLGDQDLTASMIWKREGESERKTDALHCCMSTPVLRDKYIFGVDSYGELRCLDMLTGDRIWEDLTAVKRDRWANIHMVQNGKHTYMFNEHGELIIAQLSGEGFREIDRAKLIEPTTAQLNRRGIGVTWAHPAFANRHVYIRSDAELVCADLSSKD